MKTTKVLAILIVFTILISCKKNDDEVTLNAVDEQFLKAAARSNANEIDAGSLASAKATDGSVKQYGALMLSEHQQAQNELLPMAETKRVTVPTSPDERHMAIKQQLSQMSGRAFDSAYIITQVNDHKATLEMFVNEITNGMDQQVKDYANKYLPHIQMHFNRADSTAKRFK